ncbi:formate/nitrite transporter family protein [Ilyobacter polytropus]|uniref:Formate/nitrite transporter n=1 Tax=Ilyobacter polytropus (strain ATCC 51220 / DSM 2926 / LMG 16218 / CuHBu1) TaxID=572544 RepID=E3HCG4_ILYPC|nr:formate/nitrite transporter family protein [Ilyobacter polytropus]ADO83940.1 formate/nitrite transporter [Ilyobacter polytropus DSM 2926]
MNKSFLNTVECAEAVVKLAIKKSHTKPSKVFLLGFMGGIFIGLAYVAYITVSQTLGGNFDAGFAKFMGATVFPVGIMLVLFVGGDLFTGNNLAFIGYCTKDVSLKEVLTNWISVWFGNFTGSIFVAWVAFMAGIFKSPAMHAATVSLAEHKVHLTFTEGLFSGFLCNILVALGVWMTFSATDSIGKIFSAWFPIMMFALSGYQHIVANMFVLSIAKMIEPSIYSAGTAITHNLFPVTIGNLLSGGIFIPVIYYTLYLKKENQ